MIPSANHDGVDAIHDALGWRPVPPPQSRRVLREWDRRALAEAGIPGAVLMENAGAAAARLILASLQHEPAIYRQPVLVWCGPGNNGGDGFVVARYLHDAGVEVRVRVPAFVMHPPGSEAQIHREILRRLHFAVADPNPDELGEAGLIVDALFGIGLARALGPPWLGWVEAMNASGRPIIALDIPSGLDADTGEALGAAVRARQTLSFVAAKLGFGRGVGPVSCGLVRVVDIGLPREIMGTA